MCMHTDVERAYLAGLIDGEGCIQISSSGYKRGYPRHELFVTVTNTCIPILSELHNEWGGCLPIRSGRKINWKDCADLRFAGIKACKPLIEEILPFLRIKRRQAELALEFCSTKQATYPKTSPEQWANRERIKAELQALNKRGISQ